MRLVDYIDEIKTRMPDSMVKDIDTAYMTTVINNARREVQKMINAVYPDMFGNIFITNINASTPIYQRLMAGSSRANKTIFSVELPADFIEEYLVYIQYEYNGSTVINLARGINPEELYSIYDNAYNTPTYKNPVYILESTHNKTTNVSGYNMLIAGLDTFNGLLYTAVNNLQLWVYYTKALDNLEIYTTTAPDSDTENIIPEIFEELVILHSMMAMLRQAKMDTMLASVNMEMQMIYDTLKDNYNVSLGLSDILIPTKE